MKKILLIAPYPYLPYFSGGQKFIAKFLEYLCREAQVTVVGSEANDWTLAPGYTGLSWLKRSFSRYYDTGLVKKITDLVRKEGHDVLICEHPYMAWLAFRIRKRTGIRVIIHTHNIEYQRFRSMGKWWWPVLNWYEKRSFRKADGIFFITPEDKQFAIARWKIREEKCAELPFGIDVNGYPSDRDESKKEIMNRHAIPAGETILSFNGQLNYKPNLDALTLILETINPLLLRQDAFRYKIIISGKNLPAELNALKQYAGKQILFTGFVTDIDTYLKATDIFLNPVLSGGGIKTKMVEAIGNGATVISTETGAAGMNRAACGEKLIIVKDGDPAAFVTAILNAAGKKTRTPAAYYEYYHWPSIIKNVLRQVQGLTGGRE